MEDNLSEDIQNEENDLSDALVISANENEANSEINSQIYASSENSQEKDFRKIIKKKDQEIDRLNAECLDLEDQVSSLKKEVESAWKTYKSSQVLLPEIINKLHYFLSSFFPPLIYLCSSLLFF